MDRHSTGTRVVCVPRCLGLNMDAQRRLHGGARQAFAITPICVDNGFARGFTQGLFSPLNVFLSGPRAAANADRRNLRLASHQSLAHDRHSALSSGLLLPPYSVHADGKKPHGQQSFAKDGGDDDVGEE